MNTPKFTPKQRKYIAEVVTKCWKSCHNEHCVKGHDCVHDKDELINTLMTLGLSDMEIHESILGTELKRWVDSRLAG